LARPFRGLAGTPRPRLRSSALRAKTCASFAREKLLMDLPRPSDFARHWSLDEIIVFLNHGSFGATPRAVQSAQSKYRKQLEKEPVRFFVRKHQELMDKARAAVAE